MNKPEKTQKMFSKDNEAKIYVESDYVYIREETLFRELSKFSGIVTKKGKTFGWITFHAEVIFFLRSKTNEKINIISIEKNNNVFELKVFGVSPKLFRKLKVLGGKKDSSNNVVWIETITKVTLFK